MNIIKNVELILSSYKDCLADYDKAFTEVIKLHRQKRLHEAGKIENDLDIITGMSLNAPALSHIPRSITNKFHSVTENVAMNYIQFLQPSNLELSKIEAMIQEKSRIITDMFERIKLIEHMLSMLNEHERYIINLIYFERYSLNKAMLLFNKQYSEFSIYTKKTLRRKKFEALHKMSTRLK